NIFVYPMLAVKILSLSGLDKLKEFVYKIMA
ncbi:hypothetical protein BER40_003659, partial [Clostridioides difficile]